MDFVSFDALIQMKVPALKKAELAREEEAKRQTERRKRKEQMSQWKNTAQHKLHVPIKVVSKPDIEESRRPPEPSPNKKRKTEVKRKQKKVNKHPLPFKNMLCSNRSLKCVSRIHR